jgi:hypothetical protein
MTVFWVAAPCRLVEVNRCFRGAYCLHHHGDDRWFCHTLWSRYINIDLYFVVSAFTSRQISSLISNTFPGFLFIKIIKIVLSVTDEYYKKCSNGVFIETAIGLGVSKQQIPSVASDWTYTDVTPKVIGCGCVSYSEVRYEFDGSPNSLICIGHAVATMAHADRDMTLWCKHVNLPRWTIT